MALHTSTPVVQDPRLVELGINVIRGIAMDAPEQADSGHSGHGDGPGSSGPRPVDADHALRPARSRVARPRPLHPLQRARLHFAVRHAAPDRVRPHARGPAPVPPVGQPDARAPRGRPHGRDRRHHRAAGSGRRRRGGHGARRALAAHHLRQRGLRPPHLRDRRRRLLHGGDLARGRIAGGTPRPGSPARLLRRQPHHHRRPDRAGLQRQRPRALRGLRLARAQPRRNGQRRRRAGGRHPGGARRAGGHPRRQADPPGAAQPHRVALAEADRHRGGPRLAVRRRGDRGHQEAPRPADRPDLLGPRRGARLLRPADRPGRRAPRGVDRALRRLEGRPRRLGRRAGRARAAGLGRRPPRLRGRDRSWPPATPSTSASTPPRPSSPACWPARPT